MACERKLANAISRHELWIMAKGPPDLPGRHTLLITIYGSSEHPTQRVIKKRVLKKTSRINCCVLMGDAISYTAVIATLKFATLFLNNR